jgi:alpha-L-arabinofuranosidase
MNIKTSLFILCSVITTFSISAQVTITLDTENVIADNIINKYGINLNAGIDNDLNRKVGYIPLVDSLKSLGVKHLRYPGGKKSLFYSWSAKPYNNTKSHFWLDGWYANAAKNTINFDEFMVIAKQIEAQPHINVAYNPKHGLAEELAAAWVKYANITKGYNVKYWEIGNEMWQKDLGLTIKSLCQIAKSYSQAMKAVDSTIFIGISWHKKQAQKVINQCGDAIDFFNISDYTNYTGNYKSYAATNDVKLIGVKESASKKIIVSEFAPSTWKKDKEDLANNTGKGIINFDQIGQYLKSRNTEYAAFWNTHWYELDETPRDAMDDFNNVLPVAQPMRLWAKFIKDQLVQIESNHPAIVSYAAFDKNSGDLNVFIINKENHKLETQVTVNSIHNYKTEVNVHRYQGKNEWDDSPSLGQVKSIKNTNNSVKSTLPATSITVMSFKSQ